MGNYERLLYNLPTAVLKQMVVRRQIDTMQVSTCQSKRRLTSFLATQLFHQNSIMQALQACNLRELSLLKACTTLFENKQITFDQLNEVIENGTQPEKVQEALDGLYELALLLLDDDNILLPTEVERLVPVGIAEKTTLSRGLSKYDAAGLKRICERLNLPQGTKVVNTHQITNFYLQNSKPASTGQPATGLFAILDQLPVQERAIYDYILANNGAALLSDIAITFVRTRGDFYYYDWMNRWKNGKEKNAIDNLFSYGLIFSASNYYNYSYDTYVVIPFDLQRVLSKHQRNSLWITDTPQINKAAEPSRYLQSHNGLQRDLICFLAACTSSEVGRTNTGHIHKTYLKGLVKQYNFLNERYVNFIYAMARTLSLIDISKPTATYGITTKGKTWLHRDYWSQVYGLYMAWLNGVFWGEMCVDPLKKQSDYRDNTHLYKMRLQVMRFLHNLEPDTFYDFESLSKAAGYHIPNLLEMNPYPMGNLMGSVTDFVQQLVSEVFYWFGIVELGWAEQPNESSLAETKQKRGKADTEKEVLEAAKPPTPQTFRITPLGAYLLGMQGAKAPEVPPEEDSFIVQANAEIYVPPFLNSDILYNLYRISEIPKKGIGNVVAITRDSVRRVLDKGMTLKELLGFLQSHGKSHLPQNVEYLIHEVGGKHGHIHIGDATMYIQTDTPIVMQELQARKEFKSLFVRDLSPTIALINATDQEKVLRDMRKAGYLPVSDDAETDDNINLKSEKRHQVEEKFQPETLFEASSDSLVKWENFAAEDTHNWENQSLNTVVTETPKDAIKDKGLIRQMMINAHQNNLMVQIAYERPGEETSIKFIQPKRIMGNFVVGISPLDSTNMTWNINRILWSRVVQE